MSVLDTHGADGMPLSVSLERIKGPLSIACSGPRTAAEIVAGLCVA